MEHCLDENPCSVRQKKSNCAIDLPGYEGSGCNPRLGIRQRYPLIAAPRGILARLVRRTPDGSDIASKNPIDERYALSVKKDLAGERNSASLMCFSMRLYVETD